MNHTPGEWSLDLSDMAIYNEIGTGICKINRQAKKAGVDDLEKIGPSIETMANASLICAAPELVTRLYNLKNTVDIIRGNTNGECPRGVSVAAWRSLEAYAHDAEETLKKVIQ